MAEVHDIAPGREYRTEYHQIEFGGHFCPTWKHNYLLFSVLSRNKLIGLKATAHDIAYFCNALLGHYNSFVFISLINVDCL